ncbi:MAG: YncE family protein, partial [Gemmatimonadales bacterium]
LSADESKVIVGTGEGYQVVDIASKTILGGQVVGSINAITRHPTQPLLYATVTGSSVLEIDAVTGDLERTFPLVGGVQGNAVSPDGALLYVADEAATSVHVVNLATGVEEPSIGGVGGFGLAISPDGAQLYLAKWDQVYIVDRATGALLRTVSVNGSARRIAFASNGVAVVTNESGWVDFIE